MKTGDRVTLNSGGPIMTVMHVFTRERAIGNVWCRWFVGDKLEEDQFPEESLTEVADAVSTMPNGD